MEISSNRQKFPRFSLTLCTYVYMYVNIYVYLSIQINALYSVKRDGRVKSVTGLDDCLGFNVYLCSYICPF